MSKRTIPPVADTADTFTPRPGRGTVSLAATADGTARFRARLAASLAAEHFRDGPSGLTLSSLGIGTYLGADADGDDDAYADAIRAAVRGGINVIDTAINYRCQRSERAVGRALRALVEGGQVTRDEIVVCTKAGYIPLEDHPPATQEGYQGYLKREFYARRVMTPDDVVAGGHCLAPGFLADCLRRSRRNLGVEHIDLFYLHNPEQQLGAIGEEALHARIRAAFALLEERVAAGEIGMYGVSTWQGFRTPPGTRGHLAMRDLVALAREVAGDGHHLRAVQMPLSLAMPEAVRLPTQPLGDGTLVPAVEAASALGLSVITSAPLMQGRLTRAMPPATQELFPALATDAQRALAFVRSMPGVATTLVGMRSTAHVAENLAALQ